MSEERILGEIRFGKLPDRDSTIVVGKVPSPERRESGSRYLRRIRAALVGEPRKDDSADPGETPSIR